MPRGRPKNVPQKVYDEIVGATSSAGPAENPAPGMPSAGTTKRVLTERDVAEFQAVTVFNGDFSAMIYERIVAAFCGNPNIMPQSGVLKPEYYRLAKDIARRIHEERETS